MTVLDIRFFPDPVLKLKTKPISVFDKTLKKVLDDMAETMYDASGVGLAAPQVGILQKICVIDVSEKRNDLLFFINPEIIKKDGKVPSEEGCLSIPGYRDTIDRSNNVVVRAQDLKGDFFELDAEGLLSICAQHEIDHLDGVLFID